MRGRRQGTRTGWADRFGRPVEAPEPPASGSHYAAIGDFQGSCYERNAFAMSTGAEVALLADALLLEPGMRLLDLGCGTGRHARVFAARGLDVVGLDLSAGLLAHAQERLPGRWLRADARALPLRGDAFDAVTSVCQGAFSIGREGDRRVLAEAARVARPGARLAVTAYALAFAERYLAPGDAIDAGRALVHTRAEVRGPDGHERAFDLWTQCYTPADLTALAADVGLQLEEVVSIEDGQRVQRGHERAAPELLAVYAKP